MNALSPSKQGRNYGLKSEGVRGTNAEGEQGLFGSRGERGENGEEVSCYSADFGVWEGVELSQSVKNGFTVI